MKAKIAFTGGHHNSALVVAEELKRAGYDIVWLGHKFTMRGDKQVSAEFSEVSQAGIPFYELKAGKVYKKKNPMELFKVAFGFVQALVYLASLRPKLIIAFGGYLSVPVVFAGWLLRIPSVTHEQTVTAGWANKAIAPFVKKIFLTHQSSLKNYPAEKAVVVGLPLRRGLLAKHKFIKPKPPLIYITCGKQGSHIINQAVFPIIPRLVEKYKVVHQTGAHTISADQERARRVKAALPKSVRHRYRHSPYFFGKEAIRYLKTASLVISRAGAHTVYELMLLNKRAVVIPIPWVSHEEQLQNARLLAASAPAVILEETQLTPETLDRAISEALKLPPKQGKKVITDATQKMIKQLKVYLR
jgi:UDP-N-acetylglucosamine--N-acetylmuramyl-(pentapeptide) pyrophosphoryl-undecaprenol N-acetylglucosamine transferase